MLLTKSRSMEKWSQEVAVQVAKTGIVQHGATAAGS